MNSNTHADAIYYSENIYTVTDGMISGGVAVRSGIIVGVGKREKISGLRGRYTREYDFGAGLLMPGFIDGHTHMMPYVPKADLSKAMSIGECVDIVGDFAASHPELPVIMAEKWYAANWGGALPTREDIDSVVSDRPFLATDLDIHLLWCNTRLLMDEGYLTTGKKCGNISVLTGNRENMVETDLCGVPTGILRDEICMEILLKNQPDITDDTVKSMFDVWTGYGVTAINDMDFYEDDNRILKKTARLDRDGMLNVRVYASLDAAKATGKSINNAKRYMDSEMFRLNALKVFMDGTGAGRTAYMLRPYKGTKEYGNVYLSKEELLKYIRKADKHGLAMHVHCCGDRAFREALDVYETAAGEGIIFDERFSIEHCDTTAIEDVERPAKLGISLNLTPDFLAPTCRWSDNPYMQVYDDKTREELWRLKSFIDTGVNVSFGTDYTASSMNPFDQIYRAIERKSDDGKPDGGYRMEEAVSVEEAVCCYTIGSARSVGMEKFLGSIEVGKFADMIVVDTNIFRVSPEDIKKAKVLYTIVNGRMVYKRS